jgi:hypothetical protein
MAGTELNIVCEWGGTLVVVLFMLSYVDAMLPRVECLQVEYAYVAPVNAIALRDLGLAADTVHEANFQAHTAAQHTSEF